jgi:hypothetical protein
MLQVLRTTKRANGGTKRKMHWGTSGKTWESGEAEAGRTSWGETHEEQ